MSAGSKKKKGFSIRNKKNNKKKGSKATSGKGDVSSSSSDEEGGQPRETVPESYFKSNLEGSLNREEETMIAIETGNFVGRTSPQMYDPYDQGRRGSFSNSNKNGNQNWVEDELSSATSVDAS